MIELKNVSKQFVSGRGHIAALSDISFTVGKGEGVILAGRSGSGKTTLLNCIGTLETQDNGEILYNGIDISLLNAKKRAAFRQREVGFVFQASNLLTWLTVAENLRLPLELNNVSRAAQAERIRTLLETFGLAGYEKATPVELSAGESQRISFARAIAHAPALLLADEPTANLDSANGKQLIELMFSLCRNDGTTLIIATHDQELMAMADRVIALKDGRMS